MPNIDKLLKQNNAGFKRYTGIHKATFYEMLDALQQHEAQKTKSGRPSALSLEEQILLALTYWREYRTLYHISMDFGIHESSASRIIRKVEDVLIDSGKFELPKKLPNRVDDDIKKKQHTLKAQVIVHWKTGSILNIQTSKGSVHDFKRYKETCPDWLPCDTKLLADSGYQGIAKLHKQTFTPFKKPRGGQLLDLCKQANHYLAKFRIMVEHKIGLIKLFKIVAHRYRNRRQRYDLRMKLFAGVVNFELNL